MALRARTADFSQYDSVRSPAGNTADWGGFYAQADHSSDRVRAALSHRSHLLYGDDPCQLINLFDPPGDAAGAPRPVFVFVHGGAFSEGHPDHYDYLAAPFVAKGAVYAGVGYRLVPEGSALDAVDDVAKAIGWVYRNLGDFGGDPGRLYLGGHSAGAIIAAILGTRDGWQAEAGVPLDVVRGIVCISGTYFLRHRARAFGLTEDEAESMEARRGLTRVPPRSLVAYGSLESGRLGAGGQRFLDSNLDLSRRLRAEGSSVTLLEIGGADHAEMVRALGDAGSAIFGAVAGMIGPGQR